MKIVVDASVLIALGTLGRLDLIPAVFSSGTVFVPRTVWEEVVTKGGGRPGATAVARCAWLQVKDPGKGFVALVGAEEHLDPGEAAAIALAHELKADVILMDEKSGRRAATRSGLAVLGTLGLLLGAKQSGMLAEIRPELARLRGAGFFLHQDLCDHVLKSAGELP